jgi:hypothetical protein
MIRSVFAMPYVCPVNFSDFCNIYWLKCYFYSRAQPHTHQNACQLIDLLFTGHPIFFRIYLHSFHIFASSTATCQPRCATSTSPNFFQIFPRFYWLFSDFFSHSTASCPETTPGPGFICPSVNHNFLGIFRNLFGFIWIFALEHSHLSDRTTSGLGQMCPSVNHNFYRIFPNVFIFNWIFFLGAQPPVRRTTSGSGHTIYMSIIHIS